MTIRSIDIKNEIAAIEAALDCDIAGDPLDMLDALDAELSSIELAASTVEAACRELGAAIDYDISLAVAVAWDSFTGADAHCDYDLDGVAPLSVPEVWGWVLGAMRETAAYT